MIVQLNEDWRLASDPLQWVVQKRRTVKGTDKWVAVAFYRTLDSAVLGLAQRQIQIMEGTYGPEALMALCKALDSLRDDIHAALEAFSTEAAAYMGKNGA